MDAGDWDARYAASDLVWGSGPNRFVEAELGHVPPGRALDVACGEGRNTIWLAARGWHATGVDFSPVAVERAQHLAADKGVADRAGFAVADAVRDPLPDGPFDAVVVAYLHLTAGDRRTVLRKAAERVAPGGTLLVVGHDSTNLGQGVGGPQDPAVLFTAEDVMADLAGTGLAVEEAGRVARPVPTDAGPRTALDALVRAHRQGTG